VKVVPDEVADLELLHLPVGNSGIDLVFDGLIGPATPPVAAVVVLGQQPLFDGIVPALARAACPTA
jgi:hypothetical protein